MSFEVFRIARISRTAWSRLYVSIVSIFALSVLIQIAFAGDAALLDAAGWHLHTRWVAIFQWLSVALAVLSLFASRNWSFRVLNLVPILILLLQYVTIHYAINHGSAWVVGLHASGGAILFGFLIFLVTQWRYRGLPA
jgi:hypothetical protein